MRVYGPWSGVGDGETVVDLRSDTVTRPTDSMREAMARAPVGDDVYGEDPTVRELEQETARTLGMEDAVFVPSGTMANQVAILAQTRSGDELWTHGASHVVQAEQGGPAVLGRLLVRTWHGEDGMLTVTDVEPWLKDPDDVHNPRPRMIWIENTVGCTGGGIVDPARQRELTRFAHAHGMVVHLDGSRLWNAAVASGCDVAQLAAGVDSASVCFSKGLGAPVGSAFAGSARTVERARRARKLLGGGMRQAGVIAAGALHGLRHHVERLGDDHARARRLGAGLRGLATVHVQEDAVATNMVLVHVDDPAGLVAALRAEGVLGDVFGARTVRFVVHLDIDDADVERAVEAVRRVDAERARTAAEGPGASSGDSPVDPQARV